MNATQIKHQESAAKDRVDKTAESLKSRGFKPIVVNTRAEALETIRNLIPKGASIMNGASVTLEQIGFIDLLKNGRHEWNNLHATVLAEPDPAKQALLRRQSVVSDFYLGSVHALSLTGEMIIASNSGSQLPHLAFTSPNIILVVGIQKIVPTLEQAFERLEKHVVPLEDKRMKAAYGFGTSHAKTLILHRENPAIGRNVHVIIVNENLGF
jgi:L-lactate utilization protein LutB